MTAPTRLASTRTIVAVIAISVGLSISGSVVLIGQIRQLRGGGSSAAGSRSSLEASASASAVQVPGSELARRHCMQCHQLPDPVQLPRETWPWALAWMGNYLGVRDADPAIAHLVVPELVPKQPLVTAAEFALIRGYYLENAPSQRDLVASIRKPAASGLDIFDVAAPAVAGSPVSLVRIEAEHGRVYASTSHPAQLEVYDREWRRWLQVPLIAPAVHLEPTAAGIRLDVIGDMLPPDHRRGEVLDIAIDGRTPASTVVVDQRRRLVQHRTADLDGDGIQDLALASFGSDATGDVSLLWGRAAGGYDEQQLISRSGALGVEVRDVDGDGRLDVLVPMAQGRNELLLFLNRGRREFACVQLMEWSSSFGMNGVTFADMDGDGREDLVVFSGNNLEFPDPPLRPYHGVRILSRRGGLRFEETFFYPMHGVICARAADLDGDGDLDLAACSFVPDWSSDAPETFTWLEQTAPGVFVPHTLDAGHLGRWMCMDIGDLDGDGRPDIVLGGGFVGGGGVPPAQYESYESRVKHAPTILYLHNHGKFPDSPPGK